MIGQAFLESILWQQSRRQVGKRQKLGGRGLLEIVAALKKKLGGCEVGLWQRVGQEEGWEGRWAGLEVEPGTIQSSDLPYWEDFTATQ